MPQAADYRVYVWPVGPNLAQEPFGDSPANKPLKIGVSRGPQIPGFDPFQKSAPGGRLSRVRLAGRAKSRPGPLWGFPGEQTPENRGFPGSMALL